MNDYISRAAVYEELNALPHEYRNAEQRARTGGIAACKEIVRFFPAADVVEVRHSHWNEEGLSLVCADCGWMQYHDIPYGYCPNCGAMMNGGHGDGTA